MNDLHILCKLSDNAILKYCKKNPLFPYKGYFYKMDAQKMIDCLKNYSQAKTIPSQNGIPYLNPIPILLRHIGWALLPNQHQQTNYPKWRCINLRLGSLLHL